MNHTWVRDLLHQHFSESLNKTSRACQRRINYMLKNQTTVDNVALFLAELHQDPAVLRDFPVPESGSLGKEENERRLQRDFEPLVNLLLDKYQRRSSGKDALNLPDNIEDIYRQYIIVHPLPSITNEAGEFQLAFYKTCSALLFFCCRIRGA